MTNNTPKVVLLFVNIRFHHTIKLNNQKFAEEKKKKNKRNRKMLKLAHLWCVSPATTFIGEDEKINGVSDSYRSYE